MFLGLAVFILTPTTIEPFTGGRIGVVDEFNAPSKTPGNSLSLVSPASFIGYFFVIQKD